MTKATKWFHPRQLEVAQTMLPLLSIVRHARSIRSRLQLVFQSCHLQDCWYLSLVAQKRFVGTSSEESHFGSTKWTVYDIIIRSWCCTCPHMVIVKSWVLCEIDYTSVISSMTNSQDHNLISTITVPISQVVLKINYASWWIKFASFPKYC